MLLAVSGARQGLLGLLHNSWLYMHEKNAGRAVLDSGTDDECREKGNELARLIGKRVRIRAYEERYQTTCCRKCGSEIDGSGWCANYCMDEE